MAEKLARAKELRGTPEADLQAQLVKLRQELWQQHLKVKDGTLKQAHRLSLTRRQIARTQTILREQRGATVS